jgi:hypothetical protein
MAHLKVAYSIDILIYFDILGRLFRKVSDCRRCLYMNVPLIFRKVSWILLQAVVAFPTVTKS